MKIQTFDKDIGELSSSGFYRIPRFQRPYSWEAGEVEDFWNDTIVNSDSDYFIGAIVLYTWEKGVYGVVDGQQRLATVAMTLCTLRNVLREEGFKDFADGVHGLIERKDINNHLQFVIQTESSYPYWQEHILRSHPSDEIPKVVTDEEQRLQKAFAILGGKIRDAVKKIHNDNTPTADKQNVAVKKKLLEIRDRILAL